MYKRRFTKWKFWRNNNQKVAQAVLATLNERNVVGEEPRFFRYGRELDMRDLMRYTKRKGLKPIGANLRCPSRPSLPHGLVYLNPRLTPAAVSRMSYESSNPPTVTIHKPASFTRLTLITVCSSQFNLLRDFERFLSKLWNYVKGSFEDGTWLCRNGENYCSSSKTTGLKIDVRGWISNQVEDGCHLFDLNEPDDAGLRLVSFCDSAKTFVRFEAFNLIPELIISALEQYKRHPAVIRKILNQFREMSLIIHERDHALTRILTYLVEILDVSRDASTHMLRTAMSMMADCVSRTLGRLHMQSVALIIDGLECGCGQLANLESLLRDSDSQNGVSSDTSIECLRAMAYITFSEHGNIQATFSLVREILNRIEINASPQQIELGLITALSIQIDFSMRTRQYHQAVHAINILRKKVDTIDASDSVYVPNLLFQLEECQRHLGQQSEAGSTKIERRKLLPTSDSVILKD